MICSVTKASNKAFRVICLLTLALAVAFGADTNSLKNAFPWEAHAEETSPTDDVSSSDSERGHDTDTETDNDNDNEQTEHAKKQIEPDTPVPEEEEKTPEEELDEAIQKVLNPTSNEDVLNALEGFPAQQRKLREAILAAETAGKPLDLFSGKDIGSSATKG